MRHFNKILSLSHNQKVIFTLFVSVISLPNFVLFFTEFTPLLTRICNIVLPFSIFWFLMTLSRKPGIMFFWLILFAFFDAFQLVLLDLFGEAVIAVDMFLNLVTTNSVEASELLGNLLPALILIAVIFIPCISLAVMSVMNHRKLSSDFIKKQRKYSLYGISSGVALLILCYITNAEFQLKTDIYPVNVCYNMGLAFARETKTQMYSVTSHDFKFGATTSRPKNEKEIYIFVVGETARADNFAIYGYKRDTNPYLMRENNLVKYKDALSESNTTHKSVPMLLSAVSAECFDSIYHQKGILTAFKEAGYSTLFISNQSPNHSFIDFFGEEAEKNIFVKEGLPDTVNVSDDELLNNVAKELASNKNDKIFIVLHMYGSHFNYQERYPASKAYFKPDSVMSTNKKYKDNLINAYDNTIRYTDEFLHKLIAIVDSQGASSALLYTSDHGEDLYDDSRNLFLHASPIPSYYQIHVPLLFWSSEQYEKLHSKEWNNIKKNSDKAVSTNKIAFFTMLGLSGIDTPYLRKESSLANDEFKVVKRYYLNDHNLPKAINKIGLKEEDAEMFHNMGLLYP